MIRMVAPRAGAWIETSEDYSDSGYVLSPPARGRGLKLKKLYYEEGPKIVAPRAGAWIETGPGRTFQEPGGVAPRAGAWIETRSGRYRCPDRPVAPRAGAWIETLMKEC